MSADRFIFEDFSLDLSRYELRRQGRPLRLEKIPMELLILLLQRGGQLAAREEIIEKLWGKDVFLDAEQGINTAIRKIRQALHDDPDNPRFVQTVFGKGYRFVAPVRAVERQVPSAAGARIASAESPATVDAAARERELPGGDFIESVRSAFERDIAPVRLPFREQTRLVRKAIGVAEVVTVAAALLIIVQSARKNRFSPPKALAPIRSLVVLPFENLSGDPAQDYFADGMTDALTTDLAKIGSIRVISRTSATHYKGTRTPLPEIARELDVDAAVEGSVVKAGTRVRLTAQLIDARTDEHLWAENFEKDLQDIVSLQGDLTRAIAGHIRAELAAQEMLGEGGTKDPAAEDAYLRARYYLNQTTPEGLAKSLDYFEVAAQKDPEYAPAYAGMASAHFRMIYVGEPPGRTFPLIKGEAKKALELDETLASPHAYLGFLQAYEHRWTEAEAEFKRALELNPGDSEAHAFYAQAYLSPLGQHEDAIAEMKQAVRLDPLSPVVNANFGYVLFMARRSDEAIDQFQKTLGLDPNFISAHWGLMEAYELKKMYPEALSEFQHVASLAGRGPEFLESIRQTYESSGVNGYWRKRMAYQEDILHDGYPSYTETADACAESGDKEMALSNLKKGIAERDIRSLLVRVDPMLDSLRSDPRFQDLLRRMNFPPEQSPQ